MIKIKNKNYICYQKGDVVYIHDNKFRRQFKKDCDNIDLNFFGIIMDLPNEDDNEKYYTVRFSYRKEENGTARIDQPIQEKYLSSIKDYAKITIREIITKYGIDSIIEFSGRMNKSSDMYYTRNREEMKDEDDDN